MFDEKNKESFLEKIKTINKQIKLIEKLVNEFSDFARMPKPIFKKNDLNKIIKDSINLMKTNDRDIDINFVYEKKIFIYNPSDWDIFSYSKLRDKFNLDIKISEQSLRHEFLLEMFRKSKYHISFNLSDGIPNTFLETLFCNSIS